MIRKFWDPDLDNDPVAAGNALVGRHAAIEANPQNQLARNVALLSACLYENAIFSSLYNYVVGEGGAATGASAYVGHKSPDNVLRAAVLAAQAIICRNRTRPTFLSRGGDWEVRDQVARMNKICDA